MECENIHQTHIHLRAVGGIARRMCFVGFISGSHPHGFWFELKNERATVQECNEMHYSLPLCSDERVRREMFSCPSEIHNTTYWARAFGLHGRFKVWLV